MPPPVHRKKPFSVKQKKKQLQEKRDRKKCQEDGTLPAYGKHKHRGKGSRPSGACGSSEVEEDGKGRFKQPMNRLNFQPGGKTDKGYDPNRYRLHFGKESREEIEGRKKLARVPYETLSQMALEVDHNDIYQPGSVLDMPKRPHWDYSMSKANLLAREEKYFRNYLENIYEKHELKELSYFEYNLETWRQLWRVLEMSDVVLLITDIRHPVLHFCPTLYDFVTRELQKPIILVLNKMDLAPPALVTAWKHQLQARYPQLHIVYFTSFPKDTLEEDDDPGKVLHKRRKVRTYTAMGPKQLLHVCESIAKGKVDLSSWRHKIHEREAEGAEPVVQTEANDGSYQEHTQYKDGVLTIGCCGYPNVGKSSLINGLVGKKVVSTSRTAGHTKHFQTIFLTPTVRLCDSPGLVFPSLVEKPLQILAGIYPIAQVREPYTAVMYLAQRIPLPQLLKLRHPEAEGVDDTRVRPWSAFDICDAWAEKKGYIIAKTGNTDLYRAANHILRMAVEGQLCMCMRPIDFTPQKTNWQQHSDTLELIEQLEKFTIRSDSDDERQEVELSSSEEDNISEADDSGTEDSDDNAESREKQSKDTSNNVSVNNPYALLGDDD